MVGSQNSALNFQHIFKTVAKLSIGQDKSNFQSAAGAAGTKGSQTKRDHSGQITHYNEQIMIKNRLLEHCWAKKKTKTHLGECLLMKTEYWKTNCLQALLAS